ncbi:hypothetical protein OIV83_003036 [Microbotryomycetes sp. JL201]|nr:hypothetical protein OIV83_003036 [Microbotryomycetes sp. JL201]
MGSPDPGGRQISGLGGGVSSLSKAMIIGLPGEGRKEQRAFGDLPGPAWADEGSRDGVPYDLVYRSATCGNMLAAVALSALSTPILPYSQLFERARALRRGWSNDEPIMLPLSILSASNSAILRARVPIDPISLQPWDPPPGQGEKIAGVPEEGAGIELETPLQADDGSSGLVTGQVRNDVDVEGKRFAHQYGVSIVSAGLPNIFVDIKQFQVEPELITASAETLTSHPTLLESIESLRQATATACGIPISLASPKVTVLGRLPPQGYISSNGSSVARSDADLVARAISSGDWHRTIPGTTLSALNVAAGIPGTLVHEMIAGPAANAQLTAYGTSDITIRAAHEAGVTQSTVRFEDGKPQSVVLVRTARQIMCGEVMVPERVFM